LQILDTNPQLFFHLQQQRLIELIRCGKIEEALEFAQEELAPRGEENVSSVLILLLWKYSQELYDVMDYYFCTMHAAKRIFLSSML
jgi:hypothetical protein